MDIDKDKLDYTLLKEWKKLLEGILDIAQLTVPSQHWTVARSKILRLSNDFMRSLRAEFDLELTSKEDKQD